MSSAAEDLKYSRDAVRQVLGNMGHLSDLRTDLFATGPNRHVVILPKRRRGRVAMVRKLWRLGTEWQVDASYYAVDRVDASLEPECLPADYRRLELPPTAILPYVPRSCCFDTVAPLPDADVPGAAAPCLIAAYSPVPPIVHLALTFRDQRQFQDYQTGLVQLVDTALLLLARVVVALLAAFARRTKAPIFLLVMLSTVLHFGHRSEPDHLSLPAPALKFHRGSVRLAA